MQHERNAIDENDLIQVRAMINSTYFRGHSAGTSAAAGRIQELLEANNGYLERARSSEEEAKRLRRILHLIDELSATKSGDPRLGQIRTVAIHALAGGDIHVFEFAR